MTSNTLLLEHHDEHASYRAGSRGREIDSAAVLASLDDPDCRTLLQAATDEALTVQEAAERCDIARSTTYRKVEQLNEAGLLTERVRLRRNGKHASEYLSAFEDLTISLSPSDGFEVGISRADWIAGD